MKTQRQFILDTLLPYKNDKSLCAYGNGGCRYITTDGRKCAVGKHMRTGEWQKALLSAIDLFNSYDKIEALTNEAYQQNFNTYQWMLIQAYHDHIAVNSLSTTNLAVTKLEASLGVSLDELRF